MEDKSQALTKQMRQALVGLKTDTIGQLAGNKESVSKVDERLASSREGIDKSAKVIQDAEIAVRRLSPDSNDHTI
jgi:hypothetical protein